MGSKSQQSRETSLQVESLQHPTARRSSRQKSVSRSSKKPAPRRPPPSYSPPRHAKIVVHQKHQQQQQVETQTFNKNDPKYKCFFGTFHIKNGAIAVGVVEVLLNIFTLLMGVGVAATEKKPEGWDGVIGAALGFLIFVLPCFLCYFAAFPARTPYCFIGYIVFLVVYMIVTVAGVLFGGLGVVLLFMDNKGKYAILLILAILFTLAMLALRFWFFWIVCDCWQYYNDCKRQKSGAVLDV